MKHFPFYSKLNSNHQLCHVLATWFPLYPFIFCARKVLWVGCWRGSLEIAMISHRTFIYSQCHPHPPSLEISVSKSWSFGVISPPLWGTRLNSDSLSVIPCSLSLKTGVKALHSSCAAFAAPSACFRGLLQALLKLCRCSSFAVSCTFNESWYHTKRTAAVTAAIRDAIPPTREQQRPHLSTFQI